MKQVPAAVVSLGIVGSSGWYILEAISNPYILVMLPISGAVAGVWMGLTRNERRLMRLRSQQVRALTESTRTGVMPCPECHLLPKFAKPSHYWRAECQNADCTIGDIGALEGSRSGVVKMWNEFAREGSE